MQGNAARAQPIKSEQAAQRLGASRAHEPRQPENFAATQIPGDASWTRFPTYVLQRQYDRPWRMRHARKKLGNGSPYHHGHDLLVCHVAQESRARILAVAENRESISYLTNLLQKMADVNDAISRLFQ